MKIRCRFLSLMLMCALCCCGITGCKTEESSVTGDSLHRVDTTTSSVHTTIQTTTTTTTTATTAESTEATQTTTDTTASSESLAAASKFVGAWSCTGVEQNGVPMTLEKCFDVEDEISIEVSIDLDIYADGTFAITLSLDNTPVYGTWSDAEHPAVFTAMDYPIFGVLTNDGLTLYEDDEKMFFIKQE
ncbi:MAG: hypothetical protein E7503_03240 [Ruminococcus sp.]|nr:hypothetical protein [Ruminococcus sp.]